MNNEQLGFDSSIGSTSEGKKFIEIIRDGLSERLILDSLMKRAPCVAGRATTCWKAHREWDKAHLPLVIKDSWQYPEREEEGKLLAEATEKGVVNVARYYYHETVHVGGIVDDIRGNVRKGLLSWSLQQNYLVTNQRQIYHPSPLKRANGFQKNTELLKVNCSCAIFRSQV
jgi:hypothetical protein